MVDKFKPQEFDINSINGGVRYKNGDGIYADSINVAIEASAYAQALATNPPDTTNANNVGTPTVSIQKTFDGTPQLKFENLKGGSGAKLVSQTLQGQDANGGNIYLQTFDDGTTATFVAPQGKQGESGGVTGVKGNAESSYRTGNVNITPANIGALVKDDLKTNVYPVGSIYMSTKSTSPASFLGGSWTRIYGQFLLGAGTTPNTSKSYTAGTTGGSADAVAVAHQHFGAYWENSSKPIATKADSPYNNTSGVGLEFVYGDNKIYSGDLNYFITKSAGESGTGKNMPPYLVVYMWKRTA